MAHLSENTRRLAVRTTVVKSTDKVPDRIKGSNEVCMIFLPTLKNQNHSNPEITSFVSDIATTLGKEGTLITIGETPDLVNVQLNLERKLRYQIWFAIKKQNNSKVSDSNIPSSHFGALVHTKYNTSLRHTKTRIGYEYCLFCQKTTKDYGGKKHTYHKYGTLLSDVWRDIEVDPRGDITVLLNRFADLFGVEQYSTLEVLDCRSLETTEKSNLTKKKNIIKSINNITLETNILINGDCLKELKKIPDNSIDFIFADPPYNLEKKYIGYTDDLEIKEYFDWCDNWLQEITRILKPGRTCAILNIPLWSVRHFEKLKGILQFQNWIAWESLSFPVRMIMPSHYAILCFSKGKPRDLPGLTADVNEKKYILPPSDKFCNRSSCIANRSSTDDRGKISDIWSDIHRLKHNIYRVDHPCQLPPKLMQRLIALFTVKGEVVLDCFNGAGTTTLVADMMKRRYIGIEKVERYHNIALQRHTEIQNGLDPFRKMERKLTVKNSPVPRLPKTKYEISKKALQLEVKRIANKLGRIPSRDEVILHSKYPVTYYDQYFSSWGEVCAAARTTGMSETKEINQQSQKKLSTFLS